MSSDRYQTVFISDIHLGFKGCQAEELLEFLNTIETKTLYLVGDIIDVWQMKKGVYWPQSHNNVLRKIFGMAKTGTRIIYIPGNHDEIFREYDGSSFGNIEIKKNAIHRLANGKQMLVMHGDELDAVVQSSKLVAMAGSTLYDWLLKANYWLNLVRRKLGFKYWSLSACIKHKVKNAVSYISNFEQALTYEAKRRGVDGLICGHIHHAEISEIDGLTYCNDGDWVESCTALTEDFEGNLEILHWMDRKDTVQLTVVSKDKAA
ncbi:MAG: UDP-2,3-diacylglucosamine diphosphatase [Pseudomonadales bacterium]|nr:UDP-2,3-diacylglucosamine diphosphatase [Pseudomonadales bacterium]